MTIEVARQVTVSTPQGGNDSNDVRLEPGQKVFLSSLSLVNRNCIVVFFLKKDLVLLDILVWHI